MAMLKKTVIKADSAHYIAASRARNASFIAHKTWHRFCYFLLLLACRQEEPPSGLRRFVEGLGQGVDILVGVTANPLRVEQYDHLAVPDLAGVIWRPVRVVLVPLVDVGGDDVRVRRGVELLLAFLLVFRQPVDIQHFDEIFSKAGGQEVSAPPETPPEDFLPSASWCGCMVWNGMTHSRMM